MSDDDNFIGEVAAPDGQALPDAAESLVLLRNAQNGDKNSLNELVRRYEPRLRRIVRARLTAELARRMEAADIVQITFQSAVTQLSGFRPSGQSSLLQWLSTIATHKIRDEFDRLNADKRAFSREQPIEVGGSSSSAGDCHAAANDRSPSSLLFLKELEQLFDEAVQGLPDAQREVVLLRDYYGYNWDDVARQLSRESVHAARQLHQRAWITLRRKLGPRLRSSF